MYADRGYATINLRAQFVTDLIKQLKIWQKEGHDIVLMMDANESSVHGSAVDRLIYACGLTNVHVRETEALEPPPTYHRGSSKIDFVLVSSRVTHSVVSRTILPIHDGYLSDHRALLVDFDAKLLFGGHTSDVVPPRARQLTSTNPKAVSKYMKLMLQQMETHSIWQKVSEMQLTSLRGEWTNADNTKWERWTEFSPKQEILRKATATQKRQVKDHGPPT